MIAQEEPLDFKEILQQNKDEAAQGISQYDPFKETLLMAAVESARKSNPDEDKLRAPLSITEIKTVMRQGQIRMWEFLKRTGDPNVKRIAETFENFIARIPPFFPITTSPSPIVYEERLAKLSLFKLLKLWWALRQKYANSKNPSHRG